MKLWLHIQGLSSIGPRIKLLSLVMLLPEANSLFCSRFLYYFHDSRVSNIVLKYVYAYCENDLKCIPSASRIQVQT